MPTGQKIGFSLIVGMFWRGIQLERSKARIDASRARDSRWLLLGPREANFPLTSRGHEVPPSLNAYSGRWPYLDGSVAGSPVSAPRQSACRRSLAGPLVLRDLIQLPGFPDSQSARHSACPI